MKHVIRTQYYRKAPSPWEKVMRGYFSPNLNAPFHFAGDVTEPRERAENVSVVLLVTSGTWEASDAEVIVLVLLS